MKHLLSYFIISILVLYPAFIRAQHITYLYLSPPIDMKASLNQDYNSYPKGTSITIKGIVLLNNENKEKKR